VGGYAEYRYDGLGRRTQKKLIRPVVIGSEEDLADCVEDGFAITITRFVYNSEDILLEYGVAFTPNPSYTWSGPEVNEQNFLTSRYTHDQGIDELLVTAQGTESFFSHADVRLSIRQVSDAAASIQSSYAYDSFGKIRRHSGATTSPHSFSGREFDGASGFLYCRARWYIPENGRFTSLDPLVDYGLNLFYEKLPALLKDTQELNGYIYAGNSPVNFVDPYGLCPFLDKWAACIEKWRWDWSWVIPSEVSDIAGKVFSIGNPLANLLAGGTGRAGLGIAEHATTWQHKLGRLLTEKTGSRLFNKAGKLLGRAALVVTVGEGFWDLGTIMRCAAEAALDCCER
jgi:RHS repeat-associated protein